jgi:hypothetical protein
MPGSEKFFLRLFGSGSALSLPRYGSGFTQMKPDPSRLYRVRIRESVDFSDPGSQVFRLWYGSGFVQMQPDLDQVIKCVLSVGIVLLVMDPFDFECSNAYGIRGLKKGGV